MKKTKKNGKKRKIKNGKNMKKWKIKHEKSRKRKKNENEIRELSLYDSMMILCTANSKKK